MCSKRAYTVRTEHDHSFVHQQEQTEQMEREDRWRETGLDFDPLSCGPFYMREEVLD